MNTLTMGDVGIRNTIICFYPPIPLHLKELIDIYPLEIAHMAKFNPVLSYAIMTNEDKMAFNKPVCWIVSSRIANPRLHLPDINPVSAM